MNLNTLMFHVDNSLGRGGVSLPSNFHVVMGATTLDFPVADDAVNGAPRGFTYNGNLTGSSLALTITRRNAWVMMDEAQFFNNVSTGVPEPVTSTLIGLGLVGLAILRRRAT